MKKLYIKALAALTLTASLASCGDKFLETDIYGAIDSETALNNVKNIGYALNGCYYTFSYYYFAGTEATAFGDLASDITYWNQETNHFGSIYSFKPTETDLLLNDVWAYGYKVIDNTSRVIQASKNLYGNVSDEDRGELDRYMGEAYALRAYTTFTLVNMFAHQAMVNGQDFTSRPGVVVVDTPVTPNDMVSRSSIGKTYEAIEGDLEESLKHFDEAGYDAGDKVYFTPAAVKGLQARVYLYQEKWGPALNAATEALSEAGISSLATTDSDYRALYAGIWSNSESLFYLALDQQINWSANSSGTLWSSYSYSPSPWLQSVMANDDCRRSVWGWSATSTPTVPQFTGGKFLGSSGNAAYGTCYLINAPEMFLIQAEANAHLSKASAAADALLVVAKRNPAITSTSDLPSDAAGLLSFIKDERARELFQEGHRLFDLRRWGGKVNVQAVEAPSIKWLIKDYNISDAVYPIPVDEINTNMGVTQNEGWNATFPAI